jgi:hypothetical protein
MRVHSIGGAFFAGQLMLKTRARWVNRKGADLRPFLQGRLADSNR